MVKSAAKAKTEPKKSIPLQFPSVDVVEASAGSGKTYALAKRYVQLITYPHKGPEDTPLKTILAVTFTNKATIEMKQRILEFLKKVALGIFSDERERKDISSSIAVDFESAQVIACKVMEDIIGHYNYFQVQTIDSFINTLLSGCSFHLGFASNFRIKEEYRTYLEYSLDSLIDKVEADSDVLRTFENFLRYYLFIENKEGWFFKQDILGIIESLYNYVNTYGGAFVSPEIDANDLLKKKREIIKLICKIHSASPEGTHGRFMKSLDSFIENNEGTFNIDRLSKYFGYEEFPVKKGVRRPANIARMWDKLRRDLDQLCKWESFALFKPYIDIFELTLREFGKIAGGEDIVFLQELNTHARGLVGEKGVTVPELYYRLATRFHHYLIDEFQDTNRLQWSNIFPMVEEALSSGGSFFYVGDKKQAIFRFRGGDVSLFDSVQKDFKNYNPSQRMLAKNFRSHKEIVRFNNEIFSAGNLRRFLRAHDESQKEPLGFSEGDILTVLNIFSGSEQEWKKENNSGYVSVESFNAPNADERDVFMRSRLVSLIKELGERFPYGEIAVLVRENKDVKRFSSWFLEENIPVESEKTLNIREQPLIKELISFLKFLNSPIDNLAFASFVSGKIFQKASGVTAEEVRDFLFKFRGRRKREKGVYLYTEFRRSFPEVWQGLIGGIFKNVGYVPLYELLTTILGKLKALDNFPEYQGFFMRLLELIKEKEEDYPGISKFLEHFDQMVEKDLFVNAAHANSLTVMTIHKSKGLEFPVVIIPYLEMEVSVGSGGAGQKRPYVVRQADDNALKLVQLKKSYGTYSPELARDYKEEYIRSLIDQLNSLYVALTRAKYEMYLFMPSRTSGRNNIALDLIPGESDERGRKIPYGRTEKNKKQFMHLPCSKYSDWIGVLKDEFITPSQLINRDKMLRGEILHYMLSFIGNLSVDERSLSLRAAREKARLRYPYVKELDAYMSIVRDLVKEERFKPFFYVKEGRVFQEKEIVNSYGDTKRIDRLIVTGSRISIIDYKSTRDDFEEYRSQVLEYVSIIEQIYPGSAVKGYLIFLDPLSLEEIHG